jgi:chromosome segregation ATPase
LVQFLKLKQVADNVKQLFRDVVKVRTRIKDEQQVIQLLDAQVETIYVEQQRIRLNVDSLDRTSELYQRYVKKLNAQEDQLEQIKEKRQVKTSSLLELAKTLRDLTGKEAAKDEVFGDS